jgi:alpha-tubulin suppressor-like RCC1 family protein
MVFSLLVGLTAQALPADAKAPTAKLTIHAAAASFKVGTRVSLTGSVAPPSSASVTVQRLVGKKWVTVSYAKPAATGTFTVSVKALGKPATWKVRAVRPKSGAVKAVTSNVISVHVVKTAFSVAASAGTTVTNGSPVVVTGTVTPKASGTVSLQAASGTTWRTVATAPLSKASTFTVGAVEPLGSYRLRVVKSATTAVAQGIGKTLAVTVALPPLTVTTPSLFDGTVGLPYFVQLTAAGGTPPYTWSSSVLPTGLSLSAGGLLSGTPRSAARTTVTVTVTDSQLRAASAALPVRLDLSPAAANLVHAWGVNGAGELGQGDTDVTIGQRAVGLTGATSLAGGQADCYALRFDGTVWAWGNDVNGELGDAGALLATGSAVPLPVVGVSGVTAIAAGSQSAYAVRADGTVWDWGYNGSGQLGDGTLTRRLSPVQVPGLTGVIAVAASEASAYALKSDGTVWSWGSNISGQLGIGSLVDSTTPTRVAALSGVTAIAASGFNAAALKADGTVWDWGFNPSGQLGNGSLTNSNVPVQVGGMTGAVQIALGENAGYARKADGSTWAWGYGANGALGNGASGNATTPVAVSISGVTDLAAGRQGGYAVTQDGTVKAWGYNGNYQLGSSGVPQSLVPIAVPGVTNAVRVYGGGLNGYAITAY